MISYDEAKNTGLEQYTEWLPRSRQMVRTQFGCRIRAFDWMIHEANRLRAEVVQKEGSPLLAIFGAPIDDAEDLGPVEEGV